MKTVQSADHRSTEHSLPEMQFSKAPFSRYRLQEEKP